MENTKDFPIFSIIGRTNVGKTTILNKIAQQKLGITKDQPTITRDCNEYLVDFWDLKCILIDTPGVEELQTYDINSTIERNEKELRHSMQEQVKRAISKSDGIIFVIDGRTGIVEEDIFTAKIVRKNKNNIPIILLINKSENEKQLSNIHECAKLGLDNDPILFSAEHKFGFESLRLRMLDIIEKSNIIFTNEENKSNINIGIIGRPNAGKSTFINNIFKETRVIVNEKAGTTRDYTNNHITLGCGTNINIIDTAGIKRKAKLNDEIDILSVKSAFNISRFCHVIIYMMDSENALESQDIVLINRLIEDGRIVILGFNKWDKISTEKEREFIKIIKNKLKNSIQGVYNIPFFSFSALYEQDLKNILNFSINLYKKWSKDIKTSEINRFVEKISDSNDMPSIQGIKVKIRYAKLFKIKPPTFKIFTNFRKRRLNTYAESIIKKMFIHEFNLSDVPTRFEFVYREEMDLNLFKKHRDKNKKITVNKNKFKKK